MKYDIVLDTVYNYLVDLDLHDYSVEVREEVRHMRHILKRKIKALAELLTEEDAEIDFFDKLDEIQPL